VKKSLMHNVHGPINEDKPYYAILGFYFEKRWFNSWMKRISLLKDIDIQERIEKFKNTM